MIAQTIPTPINVETLTSHFDTSTIDATDLLVAAIALVGGFVLGAITRTIVRRVMTSVPGIQPATASILARLSGYIVVVFGLVIALSAVGLSFGPVITLLLMVALIAVLIGRPLLADLGAGVVLQSRRPVTVGQVVRVDNYEGVVEDIDGRVVRVRTYDGWMVRVRNSDLLNGLIVSTAEPDRIRIEFFVGVHYDTNLDEAVEVATNALRSTVGVLDDTDSLALVDEFDDSTINLRCWIWVDPQTRWQVKDVAHRNVKRALDAAGIVIAYPQRVIHTT